MGDTLVDTACKVTVGDFEVPMVAFDPLNLLYSVPDCGGP